MNRNMEAQASSGRKGLASSLSELDPQSGSQEWHAITLWFKFFSTTYEQMHKEVLCKDQECYNNNGILHILQKKKWENKVLPKDFKSAKNTLMSFSHVRRASTSVWQKICAPQSRRPVNLCTWLAWTWHIPWRMPALGLWSSVSYDKVSSRWKTKKAVWLSCSWQ